MMMCEKNSEYGMRIKYVANYMLCYMLALQALENYVKSVFIHI